MPTNRPRKLHLLGLRLRRHRRLLALLELLLPLILIPFIHNLAHRKLGRRARLAVGGDVRRHHAQRLALLELRQHVPRRQRALGAAIVNYHDLRIGNLVVPRRAVAAGPLNVALRREAAVVSAVLIRVLVGGGTCRGLFAAFVRARSAGVASQLL